MKTAYFASLAAMIAVITSCQKFDDPLTQNTPTVTATGASDITRFEATLHGEVTGGKVSEVGIMYGTNSTLASDYNTIKVDVTSGKFDVKLSDLKSTQQYYYCVYATAGYNMVKSDIIPFITNSTGAPSFKSIAVNENEITPVSIRVSATTSDKGGNDLFALGFYYMPVAEGETATADMVSKGGKIVSVEMTPDYTNKDKVSTFDYNIEELEPGTRYAICAYGIGMGRGLSSVVYAQTQITEVPYLSECQKDANGMLQAVILNSGTTEVTEAGFVYALEGNDVTIETGVKVEATIVDNVISFNTNVLSPGNYCIKAYARNSVGYGYSVAYYDEIHVSVSEIDKPYLDSKTASTITVQGSYDAATSGMVKVGFLLTDGDKLEYRVVSDVIESKSRKKFYSTFYNLKPNTEYKIRCFVESVTSESTCKYSESITVTTNQATPGIGDIDYPDVNN